MRWHTQGVGLARGERFLGKSNSPDLDYNLAGMEAAQLLRTARRERGLTQAQLARRAGTTQSYVGRIERGEVAPSLNTLNRLLHAMGRRLLMSVEPLPHGNPSTAELRRDFEALTPAQRLREAIELSEFTTGLAESAAKQRTA